MTTASRIIGAGFENKLLRIKRTIHSTKKLLQWAHFFMDKAGYKKIESPYFNVLRHKTVYCHPRYFNATPENKICIYDILILHMSMEDKSRLISELETLNRDCQHVRKMIFQGYHNCSQIFKDGLFGTSDYNFVHLGVYKKAKAIPTYRDSSQVVFSIKPVIITKEGDGEFDLQHGSRIDIIPFEKIGGYLRNWEAEVMRLGQAAYNDEKFKHYEIQNKFDSWMVWATLLFIIPAELSLILQWNLWFLSFWFVVLVGILANISWPLHSLARYKLFCKLFEDEFFTQRWIDKCNYLKPFLIRSQQLLVQPLEKAQKDPHYEDDKKVRQVHALFSKNSQGEGLGPPIMKPVTKGPLQEEVLNGNALEEKTLQTPPSGEAMERLITPTNPPKRSIKSLLRKKPKHDVNIEIYKVQLGNLYAKLKVTTDLEAFKDTALHMIILILTCEWLRNEGTPPANVRIREVTTRQLDHFSQIERLLKQFLERHPNAIDVEEMYRLASVINIGHLDQKMISHIEWKIEDCLVDCQLLPEEKMKLLLASHRKNTSMPETITKKYPEVELKTTQEPTTNLEMVVDQDTEVVKGEIKVPTKTNASPREESTQPSDQEEIPSELPQSDIESLIKMDTSDFPKRLKKTIEIVPSDFHGEYLSTYYRFKYITEEEGYKSYKMPVCVLAYDSDLHSENVVQEFVEVARQMSEIAHYIIFNFNKVDEEIRESPNFEPLERPIVWIRDDLFKIEQRFDFNPSTLSNILAQLKEKFKHGNLTEDEIEVVEQEIIRDFERIEEDDDGDNEFKSLVEEMERFAASFEEQERAILGNGSNSTEAVLMEPDDAISNEESRDTSETAEGVVTNAIAELIDQDEPEVVVSTNAESINSSTAEREKEQLREVDLAFSKKNLFQETEFKDNGIIIDSNNVFLSFIYHLERIKHEHGENHVPKYYLVEIFDRIYEYLTALGFGPIIFYTDPDFYIYLLPEPEKTQKLSKFSPELREKYKLYSGSREENKFFNLKLSTSCFNHTKRGDDTDMLILEHASTHQYKILSNDNFDEVEYAKYRDFISRNKYTFTIVYGEITFKDEMGAELGDQLTLLELPKGKSKGMPSQTKERIKKSILHELSKQELNPFELKKKIKGKSTYIQEVIDELSRGKLISRMDDLNWSLNKSKNTSILEIVFGAFHSKIGGILIYPKCVACGKENCNCALPRTDIPRTKARVHVQKALDTEGMQFISNDDTYIARRWTYKTDFGLRKELIWAILVFLDPNSTKYNLEKDFLQEFIKDYEFKVEAVLDELVGEGLRGLELEVHFYGKLYEKIEEFVSDCWTYLTQNVKY